MTKFFKHVGAALAAGVLLAGAAQAETRVTYKSAKSGSSYYQMGVELAEAMKAGTNGDIIVTIEESQGSTQNVMEVRARGAIMSSPRRRCWCRSRKRAKARLMANPRRSLMKSARCSRSRR